MKALVINGCAARLSGVLSWVSLILTLAATLAARGQPMFEDFESYPPGASIHGQGGWEGWLGNSLAAGLVSTEQASSGAQSLRVIGGNDTVRRFAGVNSGQWTLSLQQFVPLSASGATWVVLLNRYPDDANWSLQLGADLNENLVRVYDAQGVPHGATLPLAKDRWVDLRFEVDLDANSVATFYDNLPLATQPWQSGGLNELQALDLYPDEGATAAQTGPVYYDNVRLEPAGSPPVITQQPQSQTANLGDTVTFTVTATGAAPLSYQWEFNAIALPAATQASLTVDSVGLEDAGAYRVVVTNPNGSVTSEVAVLAVAHVFHVWLTEAADIPVVQAAIQQRGGVIIEASEFFERITFQSDTAQFAEIAALPQVRRAEADLEATVFNYNSRFSSETILVQPAPWGLAPLATGLTGAGVVAGVWDGGTVGLTHPDYAGRLTVMETCPPNFLNDRHAAHVIGTMAGGGSLSLALNAFAGMAPGAAVRAWSFFPCVPGMPQTEMLVARTVPAGAPARVIDLSQNSWGYVPNPCSVYGAYVGFCADYDRLVHLHALPIFFAAGNRQDGMLHGGGAQCVVGGFGTVLPIGTAKNVVTVGAIDSLDTITTFSSLGPTLDGRLKPDVVALGQDVVSTTSAGQGAPSYFLSSGTSMATPSVSGIASLLLEQFSKLTLSAPSPALLKALLCNTATDLGNPGPDFTYGYGKVNAVKAVDAVVNGSFDDIAAGVSTGGVWTRQIPVPAGCELRAMLVWSDPEYLGSSWIAPTLVNDLDLELEDPVTGIHLPLTLDPALPSAIAVTAVNHRDNVEQVIAPNTVGGPWTIRVKGSTMQSTNPQPFAVTWCVVCPPPPSCPRQPIQGLFNTGLAANGAPLAAGAVDPHYQVISSPSGTSFTQARRATIGPPWVLDGPNSFWLRPAPSATEPNGQYVYELAFDLGCCDPSTAVISGRWAADDYALLELNGTPVPQTATPYAYGFAMWSPLLINSGFQCGVNRLRFIVHNTGGAPTGLRVELSGTVCCNAITPLADVTACEGGTATFATTATGPGPFTYAWFHNGNQIPTATAPTLTISPATLADDGIYCVEVTTPCCTVRECATLSVHNDFDVNVLGPTGLCPGQPLNLTAILVTSIGGSGPGNLTYAWTHNGNPIGGANGWNLTIPSVGPGDAGTYCVTVKGLCKTVTKCVTLTLDTTPPVLVCKDILVPCEGAQGARVTSYQVTATDNGLSLTPQYSVPLPHQFLIGTTLVTATATDACGNSSTCTFKVIVTADGAGLWTWAAQDGDSGTENGNGIATDPLGDVISVGTHVGLTTIGGHTWTSAGLMDSFVSKRGAAGAPLWANQITGTGNEVARGVAADASGNIYVTGGFDTAAGITFTTAHGAGGKAIVLTPDSLSRDIFLASWTPNGALRWATSYGDQGNDEGNDVTVDAAGDVFVTGSWTVNGITECFILKCNSADGATLAGPLRSTGTGSSSIVGMAVTTDAAGNAYITGQYGGSPTLKNALAAPVLPAFSGAFAAKAKPALIAWVWDTTTRAAGASGDHDGRGIGVDPVSGDVFITGYFNGTASLAADPASTSAAVVSAGNTKPLSLYDYYVARLNPGNGKAKWITKGGGANTSDEETRDLAVDQSGNVYVTGFSNDPASGSLVARGQRVLVVSYYGSGAVRWTRPALGTTDQNIGRSLALDRAGCLYLTGDFEGTLSFPNAPFPPGLTPSLTSTLAGGLDAFVAKLCSQCASCTPGTDDLAVNLETGVVAPTTPIPVSQSDDEWVVCDDSSGTTAEPRPATVVVPAGHFALSAPALIAPGVPGRWTACYCFCLANGFSNPSLSLAIWCDGPVEVRLNGWPIGSAPTFAFPLLIPSVNPTFLAAGQNCIEIESKNGASIGVKGLLAADSGRCCAYICGTKWNDLNGNRLRDPGQPGPVCLPLEPGLANWTIQAKDNHGNVVGSAVTDQHGQYCVGPLSDGVYTVCEVEKTPDWVQRAPFPAPCHTITVSGGTTVHNVDFGNICEIRTASRTVSAGRKDSFRWPNSIFNPSRWEKAQPKHPLTSAPGTPSKHFDDPTSGRSLRHTFTDLPACDIVNAQLTVRMRPENPSSMNDTIMLGLCYLRMPPNDLYSWTYSAPISSLASPWIPGTPVTVTVPITGLLLAQLATEKRLDVMIEDETTVDWMALEVWCCGTPPSWGGLAFEVGGPGSVSLDDRSYLTLALAPGGTSAKLGFNFGLSPHVTLDVPSLFPSDASEGASLRFEPRYGGHGLAVPIQLFQTENRVLISADFGQLEPTRNVVEIYQGLSLILSETNASPALVSVPDADAQHTPAQWSFVGEPQLGCSLTLANAVEFTLSDGRTVTGTSVRFLPELAEGSDGLLEALAVSVEGTSLVLSAIHAMPERDCSILPRLSLASEGSEVVLSWEGSSFQLQVTSELGSGDGQTAWVNVEGGSPVRVPASHAAQFYRLICR